MVSWAFAVPWRGLSPQMMSLLRSLRIITSDIQSQTISIGRHYRHTNIYTNIRLLELLTKMYSPEKSLWWSNVVI